MTDRVLSMLFQYLLSNQALELNESFQIYLKVLSIEHSKFKAAQPRKNKFVRKTFKTHVVTQIATTIISGLLMCHQLHRLLINVC